METDFAAATELPFSRGIALAKAEAVLDVRNFRDSARHQKKSFAGIAFVAHAARALSQYYSWLQKAEKPW